MRHKPEINVALLQPPGYVHSFALLEAAEYVVALARGAGYRAELRKNRLIPTGLNVLFGAHIAPEQAGTWPANTVIFNTEQLPEKNQWTNATYREALESRYVWDYSPTNLALIGHDRKGEVAFGYAEDLRRIPRRDDPQFDLVFYGSMNDRRQQMLDRLQVAGLRIATLFGLYGPERDAVLGNARAVLNLHFYESQILQQIRVFYPLTNRIPVISENFSSGSGPVVFEESLFCPGFEAFETYAVRLLRHEPGFEAEASRRCSAFQEKADYRAEFASVLEQTVATLLGANDGKARSKPAIPARMNLGSGKDYRAGYLNVDIDPGVEPDLLLDLGQRLDWPLNVDTSAYGAIRLDACMFDEILSIDVLEHIPSLPTLMTNCLRLLRDGGRFTIQVPYDLALGAWQDPTHVRAFNENSWLYFTDWFWYLGWLEHRFECEHREFLLSAHGQSLAERGASIDDLLRTPRAVDAMRVVLRKRETTPEERVRARAFRLSL